MARMSKENVARFFALLAAERPDPTTELQYINPYTLLVAVVLSAQATDVGVNKATVELFKVADTPANREALEALPGVGRKTANVVLNVVFGQPTIAVDTHIFRLANRTGLAPGEDPRAVEEALERVVPDQYLRHAHHWLILHGRYVCTARNPKCEACVVSHLCLYEAKTTLGDPAKAKASPARRPSRRAPASSLRARGRRAPRRARRPGAK